MNPDLAHQLTDQELAALEKRIAVEHCVGAPPLGRLCGKELVTNGAIGIRK